MANAGKPNFQSYNFLPFPIEVFAASGEAVFINSALMKLNGITDVNTIVGKYNLLNDPLCNRLKRHREAIKRAFSGKKVSVKDFPLPEQGLEKTDAHFTPVIIEGKVKIVVVTYKKVSVTFLEK